MVLPEVGLIRSDDLDVVFSAVDFDHVPYAGGTELVPAMALGLRAPAAIVDLKRVDSLNQIDIDYTARTLSIGAAVTHQRIADDERVREHVPTLAKVASRVGNARVRASGTIGGNLCFAEPRSDLGCVLVALNATVNLASSSGARTVTVDDFILGAFETTLAEDEILTEIQVGFEPHGFSYWKLQSYERPTLGVALRVTTTTREVTVGAATERPVRQIFEASDTASLSAFVEQLELSDDICGSPDYKRWVLRNYLSNKLQIEL